MDPASKKPKDTVFVIVVTVVVALILAALIGNSKDRNEAIDKAVAGNLRQIWAGAEQYFIVNGVSSVASTTIVGTNSSQYVKRFATVAQESYTPVIVRGGGITASGIAGARTVTYGP